MIDRRTFLASGAALAAATTAARAHDPAVPFVIPEEQLPREIFISRDFTACEIHVSPSQFALFLTLGGGRAIQYAVGIGRPGLYHDGVFSVGRKAKWPRWTPTPQMIARDPDSYARFADGVAGGPHNPLGARALYLFDARGRDTMLRIHGTDKPWTIGTRVSNGCARLVNDFAVELYERVHVGTRVVLHPVA